jgi:hypothetical protein
MRTAPPADWYYVLAECDEDGEPSANALYMLRSDREGVTAKNRGR